MKNVRINFGKIFVDSGIFHNIFHEIIDELIEGGDKYKYVDSYKSTWVFADYKKTEMSVFGRLVKFYKEKDVKPMLDGIHLKIEKIEKERVAVSHFYIEKRKRVIAFERPLRISTAGFIRGFKGIINKLGERKYEIDIVPFKQEDSVLENIIKFEKITRFNIGVKFPNPGLLEEEHKRIENFLRDFNATEGRLDLLNKAAGLEIDDDLKTEAAYITSSGYGNITVEGESDGEKSKFDARTAVLSAIITELNLDDLDKVKSELAKLIARRLGD